MQFDPPLKSAIFIRRYKRFLADVKMLSGEYSTLYCPNTGSMIGCATPGDTVWYSTSSNLKRKYVYTWEITQTKEGNFICINTLRANHLLKEALIENWVPELVGYSVQKNEVKYGNLGSRIDFMLRSDDRPECYIEIKSVTLSEKNNGYFPDSVTLRGQKHLRELISIAAMGKRAVLLFLVLNSNIKILSPAYHIDLKYAQLLTEAYKKQVEILAYKAEISSKSIQLRNSIPINFLDKYN